MQAETAKALAAGGTRIPSLRTRVEHLSGGQRQAIELNRFVHWGGKLVMLDEPFAALGVEQTRRGLETVERVRAQGIGVIMITHVMAQAFQVADRIVVLRHGIVAGDVATEATSPDEVVRMITGDIGRVAEQRESSAEAGRTCMKTLFRILAWRDRRDRPSPLGGDRRRAGDEGQDLLSRPDAARRVPDRLDRRHHQVHGGRRLRGGLARRAEPVDDRSSTRSTT